MLWLYYCGRALLFGAQVVHERKCPGACPQQVAGDN
jgi:hypothetical protein